MILKTTLIIEVVTRKRGMDAAQDDLYSVIDGLLSTHSGVAVWKATRADLEELAATGALLPNPNVIQVYKTKKRKKLRTCPR